MQQHKVHCTPVYILRSIISVAKAVHSTDSTIHDLQWMNLRCCNFSEA